METSSYDDFRFEAIGTLWHVTVSGQKLTEKTKNAVLSFIEDFDRRFSRFIETSEANAFRKASPGTYTISQEFLKLLERAELLRDLTDGLYDPAVATLLERAGYDPMYRFMPENVNGFELPEWKLREGKLQLGNSAVFDLGGMGKGYAIDRVADILKRADYEYYIVEAGGDMMATTKANGESWHVGIEWPGRPDIVVGTLDLKKQALAVSDSFRRRWGKWHHVVNPKTIEPIANILGAAAVAQNAWDADSMTSGLFLALPKNYRALAQAFGARYLVFEEKGSVRVSPDWQGELF